MIEKAAKIQRSEFLPKIVPLLDMKTNAPNHKLYEELICNALRNMLAKHMTFTRGNELDVVADQRDQFHSLLPIISTTQCTDLPGNMSFYSLSKYRANSFKFFINMVSSWLLPGKRLDVVLINAVDFRMPEISDEVYTLCDVTINVESRQEFEQILNNFPILESELRLGIDSIHYSQRILETKGLTMDVKTAVIQEYIAFLIKHMPGEFDHNVLTEMQHVLVMCPEEFKAARECRHLSRIIGMHYLFRKNLREAVKGAPQKRHLGLKLFQARVNGKNGTKKVLAVLVGINFFRDKEVFEKTHLLKAIQNYIPMAQAVEGSFFDNRRGSEHICTLYLELEKINGDEFTGDEIRMLRQELPSDLKDRIEHLMHPIFMTRNEEEIIRNILSLSSQIKFLRDIPQVFISFDEQTHTNLFFTVILVRVLRPEFLPIQELFKQSDTFLEYIHDRTKHAGILRRKYKKEATVFRVKLAKEPFLRANHSIDLNRARQTVVAELCRIVGEVRDFNGGMITKQHEVLCQLRSLLKKSVKNNDLLLENFFYSLTPVIMRNVLEPEVLRTLFMMILESIGKGFSNGESYALKIYAEGILTFVMIKTEGSALKEELSRALGKLQLHSSQLANSYVSVYDVAYIGYIFRSDDPEKQQLFCQAIQAALSAWDQKKRS